MEKKTTTIRQVIFITATPDEIYDAFLDEKKHTEFTGAKATIDPRIGGEFTAWDGYILGKNLDLVKGRRIVQEWKTTEWPDYPPSVVEFSLKQKGNRTEVTMIHSEVPVEQAESYEQGWIDFYWEPMKKYFRKKR
ncbi:SRPBCC domain-containing protein [Candidatus Bathyarchaeota archaeon]|jgi:activator of HSP90 ATPase|nr:SRPBCC domain-containing protein [Candidatus Bathyarchaeota archaeon]